MRPVVTSERTLPASDEKPSDLASQGPPSSGTGPVAPVRWWPIFLGLILIGLNARWLVELEGVLGYTWPSMYSLPLNVITILLVLLGINALLRRWKSRLALNQGELLTIYVMVAIGSALVGWSFTSRLLGWMTTPFWRATSENHWDVLFTGYLPDWLVIRDHKVLEAFSAGRNSFWNPEIFGAWIRPILAWTLFIVTFMGLMLCVNVILRKRWIDQERLTFPIVQIPYEITREDGAIFRQRSLRLGFGLATALGIVRGINYLFPSVPAPPVNIIRLGDYLRNPPWNALAGPIPQVADGGLPFSLFTWVIGLGMLMPLEITFSYWFFFWMILIQMVITSATGWQVTGDFPYVRQQGGGAIMALAPALLWSSRRYLKQVWMRAVWRKGELDDRDEPISYRAALLGLAVCLLVMALLGLFAGMSGWAVLSYLAIFFTLTLALTRARAEFGGPANEIGYVGADQVLIGFLGPNVFGPRNLALLTLWGWCSRFSGNDPFPHQLEGLKLAERARFNSRRLVAAILLAGVVGTLAAFVCYLVPFYKLGTETAKNNWGGISSAQADAYNRLEHWLTTGEPADRLRSLFLIGGFLLSLFLYAGKSRFFWWPFHPLGYALAGNWWAYRFWFSMFIAWLIKLFLLRHGGRKAYLRALPFFIGLVVGDAVIGSFWTLYGIAFKTPVFSVWIQG